MMFHQNPMIALQGLLKAAGAALAAILVGAPSVMIAGGMIVEGLVGPRAAQAFEAQVFELYMTSLQLTLVLAPVALVAWLVAPFLTPREIRAAH